MILVCFSRQVPLKSKFVMFTDFILTNVSNSVRKDLDTHYTRDILILSTTPRSDEDLVNITLDKVKLSLDSEFRETQRLQKKNVDDDDEEEEADEEEAEKEK